LFVCVIGLWTVVAGAPVRPVAAPAPPPPAPACKPDAGWDDPAPPQRVYAAQAGEKLDERIAKERATGRMQ
jgi:hypothetical protein